jgi:flavin-dependent dehydrogenase
MAPADAADWLGDATSSHSLTDGSRVAVVGGGPAGSFFSYFFLSLAQRLDTVVSLDVYEPRDFSRSGPPGCNMCGGIISESLVQLLAAEGINLPPTVIQRGIDSYVLHTDTGRVRIETPRQEKRIGAVHRGTGPKGSTDFDWLSFDGYLQSLAMEKGANVIQERVTGVEWVDGHPHLSTKGDSGGTYDLLVVAAGVNSTVGKLFGEMELEYEQPNASKTAIREFYLGREVIAEQMGSSMHVFLLDIPRLEFAAIVPKGDYASVCLLGKDIDADLVQAFLTSPEARACFPPDWDPEEPACQCWPKINVRGAQQPFGDRIVFIGDCGVARLYKDGIGSAYRTSKAAATTALLHGVSTDDFQAHFRPTCESIRKDNTLGRLVFWATHIIQGMRFTRRALVRMVAWEQRRTGAAKRMSTVLWDMFTGSAPYREALLRTFHPMFIARFAWDITASLLTFTKAKS